MKTKIIPLIALLSLMPVSGMAFFCPKNFNQIDIGDPLDKVTRLCGNPDSQTESTKSSDDVPQQWSYYIMQQSLIGPTVPNQGSVQVTYSFDPNGKILNIMVNNVSVTATDICGQPIQMGDTRDSVKSACGTAQFINKQTESSDAGQPSNEVKVVQYHYNSTPPMTLIFEGGVLTERR